MYNPYSRFENSIETSASRALAITPDDTKPLAAVCKALRIWNPGSTVATIHVKTLGNDEVTLHVPAETLWVEPLMITHVLKSGTTTGVILIGYSD
jgi:hypothetical protein